MEREADLYVRSVMMLSVAIRNSAVEVDLLAAARPIVEAARLPEADALQALAGSLAVLAGTISATRTNSATCADMTDLAESLAQVESERTRAEALVAIISENC